MYFSFAVPPLRTLCSTTSGRRGRSTRARSSLRSFPESSSESTTRRSSPRTSSWTCCFHTETYRYERTTLQTQHTNGHMHPSNRHVTARTTTPWWSWCRLWRCCRLVIWPPSPWSSSITPSPWTGTGPRHPPSGLDPLRSLGPHHMTAHAAFCYLFTDILFFISGTLNSKIQKTLKIINLKVVFFCNFSALRFHRATQIESLKE